jgi:hypothetical protein
MEQYGKKMKALMMMDHTFIANAKRGMPMEQAQALRDQQYREIHQQFNRACEPIQHYEKLMPWG